MSTIGFTTHCRTIFAASMLVAWVAPMSALAQVDAPAMCDPGLASRDAYAGDPVCVTPAERNRTRADNVLAPSRTNSDGSCASGYVWREARPDDHVCVPPATRAETRVENSGPKLAPAPSPSQIATDPFSAISGPQIFLIVAPNEFMAALQPLVAHKNATGVSTIAVSITQLTNRFPGIDDPEKIKRGIQYAHEHFGVQYVMLVGDPHWFPVRYVFFKNFSRAYPNHPDEAELPIDGLYAPSDLYYANLYHHRIVRTPKLAVSGGPFDDWNADRTGRFNEVDWGRPTPGRTNWNEPNPDRVDGYPDVAVARATAHSVEDVTVYVNKIIRYETQSPQKAFFTFVADGNYPRAPQRVDPILAKARFNFPAALMQINKVDGSASGQWITNASPADVASKINVSVWVGYLGHGSLDSWDGHGFNERLVKLTADNDALPVVFTNGCGTGRFSIETPFDSEYVDLAGLLHKFIPAPGADPNNPSVPAMVDMISGQTWGAKCVGCNPLPLVAPPPNPYDYDRNLHNFAYPWLFMYPQGGAIAYFGEVGVMEPQMSEELETDMLSKYVAGQRHLGEIYLQSEHLYWERHIDDPGTVDRHSPSRMYLGFLVMFGDPTLRLH